MPDRASGELVDVVDRDDRVERTVTRREMRAERLRHRCTFVIVTASDGRVLAHRRADGKDMWPGRWDVAAGGVVTSGEEWAAAAVRELAEELGIDVPIVALEPLAGPVAYDDDDVRELARVWRVRHDGPYRFADGEVVEARLVTVAELEALLPLVVPDSRALVVPHVLAGASAADRRAPAGSTGGNPVSGT